ncbi:M48 family metalloprotease [Brevundimonas sp.]|jgi:predicted Zn-dependent protease|uniref:M48 family metalloprotease n=1 Tax=Brevundimonas sp. TaxID=1871086 RepID=UPI002E0DB9C6|nr:M48 family metalloprotease [Brevundimonas sp.]
MSWLSRTATRIAAVLGAAAIVAFPHAASAQSLIRDTEIEGIIHDWSEPVFVAMGLEPDEITVLLVNDQELNAFATRGRIMGLNTGLIMRTRNPNELLGVIAHEAGHIKNRHTLRDGAEQAGMQPFLMTMALGALAALAGAPDAAAVLIGNSQYFGTLSALRYVQGQEGEADITAARALERAGLSGRGLLAFFENFRSQEVFSEARRFPYFRSHPLSSQRIEQLRPIVMEGEHYDVGDTPVQLAEHALVIAKIHAFMEPPTQTLRRYPASDASYPARYARAIARYRAGETEVALAAVDELLAEQPENPFLWELRGQILFEEGRAAEAVDAHRKSVELLPDAPLLHVNLAHALLESGRTEAVEDAVVNLKRAVTLEPENTLAWRLLGQAYARQGKEGEARLASAELHAALGQEQQAVQFALRARDMLEPGSIEWRRAMDIILASGATTEDLRRLDEENARRRPGVIPPTT